MLFFFASVEMIIQVFDKIEHPFMIKTLSKLGIEWKSLNVIKAICEKPTVNITQDK